MYWEKDVTEILISDEKLREHTINTAKKISEDYNGKNLMLIGVLKGGVIFLSDLARLLTIPVEFDFIAVSSYGSSTSSSGVVRILKDIDINIMGKDVLLIEDIIDTGLTLNYLREMLETRHPASLNICAALDKPSRRKVELFVKYPGIKVPDKFVVGYGLDYKGMYRNIPHVCVLDPKVYT